MQKDRDEEYLALIRKNLEVCSNYCPKFGQGGKKGCLLMIFSNSTTTTRFTIGLVSLLRRFIPLTELPVESPPFTDKLVWEWNPSSEESCRINWGKRKRNLVGVTKSPVLPPDQHHENFHWTVGFCRIVSNCTFQELYERLSKSFANYAVFHLNDIFNAVLLKKQRKI